LSGRTALPDPVYPQTKNNHGQTEQLTHGNPPQNESQLRIGIPEKFYYKSDTAISDKIEGKEKPVEGTPLSDRPEDDEQ
jgi:hypothetical protein